MTKLLAELNASPNDVRLIQQLAALYEREGKRSAAARYCVLLAELWAKDGNVFRAVAFAKHAAKLAPGNVEAQRKLVEWHEQLGLASEAAEWRLKLPGG